MWKTHLTRNRHFLGSSRFCTSQTLAIKASVGAWDAGPPARTGQETCGPSPGRCVCRLVSLSQEGLCPHPSAHAGTLPEQCLSSENEGEPPARVKRSELRLWSSVGRGPSDLAGVLGGAGSTLGGGLAGDHWHPRRVELGEATVMPPWSVGLCPWTRAARTWLQVVETGPGMGLQTSHWRGQPGGGRAPRGGRSRAWRPFIRRNELFAVPGVGEDEPVIIFKFAIIDLGKSYCDKNELIIKFISEINSAAIRQPAAGAGAAGRASPPPSPRAKGARALRAAAGSGRWATFRAPLPRAPTGRQFCLWGWAGRGGGGQPAGPAAPR